MHESAELSNNFQAATLRWLNELTAQGILTTDKELRIAGWNRWLEAHSGLQAQNMIGRSLLDVYPDLVSRRLDQAYRQALDGKVVFLAQRLHRYLLPMPPAVAESGFSQMRQSARIAPLIDNGIIIGTISVLEDVTEREMQERELRQRIGLLEALHEVSHAILSLDLPECLKRIVETTRTFSRAPLVAVVLRSEQQLQLEACSCDIEGIDQSRLNLPNSVASVVVRSGQPIHIADTESDYRYTPLLATSRSLIAVPLIVESSVIGALMVESPEAHQLTKKDQIQIGILATQAAIGIHNAQLYKNAKDAIRIRDNFLSIASHELKTPLTSLLGHAQLFQRRALRNGTLSERDQRTLNIIATQSFRLNRLVSSLLNLSRIQSGQLNVQRVPMDLSLLVQRVVDEMQLAEEHPVELRIPTSPLMINGDDLRLEQVLQNLLQNAGKYSSVGAPILVQLEQRDGMACVMITDQGIGIPAEELPLLFDQFYRVENAKAQHINGFGVGLYVVKEIMDLHDGQIEVTSEEGKGSTFTLLLPSIFSSVEDAARASY